MLSTYPIFIQNHYQKVTQRSARQIKKQRLRHSHSGHFCLSAVLYKYVCNIFPNKSLDVPVQNRSTTSFRLPSGMLRIEVKRKPFLCTSMYQCLKQLRWCIIYAAVTAVTLHVARDRVKLVGPFKVALQSFSRRPSPEGLYDIVIRIEGMQFMTRDVSEMLVREENNSPQVTIHNDSRLVVASRRASNRWESRLNPYPRLIFNDIVWNNDLLIVIRPSCLITQWSYNLLIIN